MIVSKKALYREVQSESGGLIQDDDAMEMEVERGTFDDDDELRLIVTVTSDRKQPQGTIPQSSYTYRVNLRPTEVVRMVATLSVEALEQAFRKDPELLKILPDIVKTLTQSGIASPAG